jgi:hypothetical protein
MTMTTVGKHDDSNGTNSVALARVAPDQSFTLALEPSDFRHATELAQLISDSGMFAPKGAAKISVPEAMMRLMTGRNLGIPAVIAMQHVYSLYGRTGISAALKQALVVRHPHCEAFEHVSADMKQATWKVKRKGSPEQLITFTIEDAERAGLVKPDSNWVKWRRRMLQARARSEAADIWFPDATMGLPTIDELEDEMVGEVVLPPGSPPPQAAPPRDFAGEAEALKQAIADAANGTADDKKAVRALYKKFEADAPAELVESVKRYYAMVMGEKKAKTAPTEAPAAPQAASATQTAQAPAQPAKAPQPAAQAGPQGDYLPPHQRGDSYEGPDQPPPPFGSPAQGTLVPR